MSGTEKCFFVALFFPIPEHDVMCYTVSLTKGQSVCLSVCYTGGSVKSDAS